MTYLLGIAVAIAWWQDGTLGLIVLVVGSVLYALRRGAQQHARNPRQHYWTLGLGLGLTLVGPIPYITVVRRRRW